MSEILLSDKYVVKDGLPFNHFGRVFFEKTVGFGRIEESTNNGSEYTITSFDDIDSYVPVYQLSYPDVDIVDETTKAVKNAMDFRKKNSA